MEAKDQIEKDEKGRFVTGNIGGGRPKGARNKLGEDFLQDMLADWKENGVAAIKAARLENPLGYVKVTASILPRELNLRVSEFDELTDEQLARQLAAIASQLANAGVIIGERVGAQEAPQQVSGISTIQ